MEIVHGSKLQFGKTALQHRGGGLSFKDLCDGRENTPENFSFKIGRQEDFYSPVHHHNFDQFRFALQGDVSLGPSCVLKEGQLSYHPEGAFYGPQQDEPGTVRDVLVLQFGGASGQGYMSMSTLANANKELAVTGEFKSGKYYSKDGSVKDGYQALWEHINGRKLVYPVPRYHQPILVSPDAFSWRRVDKQSDGALRRTLGVFSEREARVEQVKLAEGASVEIGSPHAIHLVFVLTGHGKVGAEELASESCVRLDPGASARVVGGSDEIVMLHFVLPLLDGK